MMYAAWNSRLRWRISQARIDGLSFEGKHAKNALVHAAKRLTADEALKRFNSESKFTLSKGAFAAEATGAQTVQILWEHVLRPVDDPEIFSTATFHRRLSDATAPFFYKAKRLNDKTFPATLGVFHPPIDRLLLAGGIDEVDFLVSRGEHK